MVSVQPASGQRVARSSPTNSYFDWSGMYVGGHVGYTRGRASAGISELNFEHANAGSRRSPGAADGYANCG